jgi:hypothetical protein
MNTKSLSIAVVVSLIFALTVFNFGCKKDESPTSPGGGGGLTTFSFGTAGQTFTVPASGGAARARLIGGALPYAVTGSPNPGVAIAALDHDTLTVLPMAPGSTSITIADSQYAHFVTIQLVVTGTPSSDWGSGTVTTASSPGNLSFTGTGVWPPQAGPSVCALYDTSYHVMGAFFVFGYQRVSGPNYNVVELAAVVPLGGLVAGTYTYSQIAVAVAYNIDTTGWVDSLAYRAVSGSIVIGSVSGSNATGTYSVMARKGSGLPIQFTGTFNVRYVVGVIPQTSRKKMVN